MTVNATNPLSITIHPLPDQTDAGTSASSTSSTSSAAASTSGQFWSSDAPTFKDVLDIINPLQHLPIISTIYQSITGDVPSSGANLIGGGLIGGAFGFASALFNEIVKTQTGKDVGGNLLAMINGESSPLQTATNTPSDYAPPPTNLAAYNAYMHAKSLLA